MLQHFQGTLSTCNIYYLSREVALYIVNYHLYQCARKFGPWKDALLEAWQAHSISSKIGKGSTRPLQPESDEVLENVRLEKFEGIIKIMCSRMKGKDCRPWVKHCNRFRGREMGPLVALRSLGFSKAGRPLNSASTRKKLKMFLKVWSAIEVAVGSEAPRTITEWYEKVKAAKKAAGKHPAAPRLKGNYLFSWHVRALLRDRMTAAGISKLVPNQGATVYQLMNLCPDQSQFLRKVYQYFIEVQKQSAITVKEFIAAAGDADTPPELLSMWHISCKTGNDDEHEE